MTFKEFLRKRRITYDDCGDFVAEALKDPLLAEARFWHEVEARVSKHQGFSAVEAAKSVWQAYQAEVRKLEKQNGESAQLSPIGE